MEEGEAASLLGSLGKLYFLKENEANVLAHLMIN
jgi:hypothetical protein